jgi:hypothetical protein
MADEPVLTMRQLEEEEARLKERLALVTAAKQLFLGGSALLSQPFRPVAFNNPQLPSIPAPVPIQIPVPAPPVVPAPAANHMPWQLIAEPAVQPSFDGTVAGLINRYRTDERSPYFQLKHSVRENYDQGLKRIIKDVGTERIAEWSANRIQTLYDENWAADGKVSMGRSLIAKLRLLAGFGATLLNDDACIRLSSLLSNMRFAPQKKKVERLTIDQARVIRATAREHFGWQSIALAQAFQYELPMLSQVDIIGEWVPLSEPGPGDIQKDGEKWVGGIRWSDIDDDMIFRPLITSNRRNQKGEFNLKRFYSIMEEIGRVPPWQRKGPIIINETTGLPWTGNEFRRKWRKVADKAGLPKNVKMGGRNDAEPAEADKPENVLS